MSHATRKWPDWVVVHDDFRTGVLKVIVYHEHLAETFVVPMNATFEQIWPNMVNAKRRIINIYRESMRVAERLEQ